MPNGNLNLSKFVGNKIREYRKKKKMTQKQLGDLIGVKHNTVSDYENGKISPEQDSLFALSKALEVSVDDFFPAHDGDKLLDRVVGLSDDNLNLEDLEFLQKIMNKAKNLDDDSRTRLFDNLRLAVDIFEKSNDVK